VQPICLSSWKLPFLTTERQTFNLKLEGFEILYFVMISKLHSHLIKKWSKPEEVVMGWELLEP